MLGVSVALTEKRQATSRRERVAKRIALSVLACLGVGFATPVIGYVRSRIEILRRVSATVRVDGHVDTTARVYSNPEGAYLLFLGNSVADIYRLDPVDHAVTMPNPQFSIYPAVGLNWHKENQGVEIGTEKSGRDVRVRRTPNSFSFYFSDKDTQKAIRTIEVWF